MRFSKKTHVAEDLDSSMCLSIRRITEQVTVGRWWKTAKYSARATVLMLEV